jgi:integrase
MGDRVSTNGLYSGRRLREPTTLRWDDVYLKDGYLLFPPENKTSREIAVPLGLVAREVLESTGTRFVGGPVFQREEGESWDSIEGRNLVSRMVTAAFKGHGRHSFKTIRTTAARVLDRAGFDDTQIGLMLSHSAGQSITNRHYFQRSAKDTAERLRPLVEVLQAWHLEGEDALDRIKAERDGRYMDTCTGTTGHTTSPPIA